MTRSVLRAGLVLFWLCAARSPQAQGTDDSAEPALVSVKDLVLESYVVQHVDENELAQLASSLVGRKVFVKENGLGNPPIATLRQLGGAIVIYDTAEQVQRVNALLKRLDVPPPVSTYSQTLDYRPRFVSLEVAYEAVSDLVDVLVADARGGLVLSGSKEELDQATAYLAHVDVPQRQVLLSCLLLEVGASSAGAAIPAELLQNLERLLPGSQFSQVGMALLQTSVAAGSKVSVQIESTGKRYRFGFESVAFDEATSSLTVSNCNLVEQTDSGTRILFETSTFLRGGEYTVLAGTGTTPRLLIVRVALQE